jgi:hypothetical protein
MVICSVLLPFVTFVWPLVIFYGYRLYLYPLWYVVPRKSGSTGLEAAKNVKCKTGSGFKVALHHSFRLPFASLSSSPPLLSPFLPLIRFKRRGRHSSRNMCLVTESAINNAIRLWDVFWVHKHVYFGMAISVRQRLVLYDSNAEILFFVV